MIIFFITSITFNYLLLGFYYYIYSFYCKNYHIIARFITIMTVLISFVARFIAFLYYLNFIYDTSSFALEVMSSSSSPKLKCSFVSLPLA